MHVIWGNYSTNSQKKIFRNSQIRKNMKKFWKKWSFTKVQKALEEHMFIIFSKIELRAKLWTQKKQQSGRIGYLVLLHKKEAIRWKFEPKLVKKKGIFRVFLSHKKGYKRVYWFFSKKSSSGLEYTFKRAHFLEE